MNSRDRPPSKIVRTRLLPRSEADAVRRTHLRLARGAYLVPGEPAPDLKARCRAALAIGPNGAMVCGPTALALVLPDVPHQIEQLARGPVHLLVPHASTAGPRRPGITVHRRVVMPQRWVMRGAGIAVAPPAECWAQVTLALVGSDPWRPGRPLTGCAPGSLRHPAKVAFLTCVQAADALMRRKLPIVTAERFAADVARLPRRNGVRAVREVFTYARPRTDSLPETHLRLLLTDAGVKDLVVNHPVTVEGETRYLDLAIPRLMVAAEYDGRHHTSDPGQVAGDIRRRAALHAAGWVTIEALWEDMGSPARLIARFRTIVAAAEARAHH